MESPPKRVTRARAAAKTDTIVKTTKVAPAAAKPRATRATATTKRKTRVDDDKDEDELQQDQGTQIEPEVIAPKSTRTKAKQQIHNEDEEMMDAPPVRSLRGKTIPLEPEHAEPPKAVRGRPKAIVIDTPGEIAKTTRGRAKKIEVAVPPVEEPKRTTRGRIATTTTKAAAPKKSVKFEEPDKENVVPITTARGKAKEAEVTTGLRAKPVRKPPVPRATRGRPKSEDNTNTVMALSPKKITQVGSAGKESQSEDELATTEKTPMKALSKSPIKAPGSIFNTVKRLDFATTTNITVNRATTQDLSASMASPARRPMQSPFKDTIRTSPHRTIPQAAIDSPFKPSLSLQSAVPGSTFKQSLMASPARRPAPSPAKVAENGSPSRSNKTSLFGATPKVTPFKMSRFATPRTLNLKSSRSGQMMPPPSAPPKFATGSPRASLQDDNSTMMVEPRLKFSGRLSSITPREVDTASKAGPVEEESIPKVALEADPENGAEDSIVHDEIAEDDMLPQVAPTTPDVRSTTTFEMSLRDESPFDESESEDELASDIPHHPTTTPINFKSISTPRTTKSARISLAPNTEVKIGFTPLATQLDNWMTVSPVKAPAMMVSPAADIISLAQSENLVTPQPDPSPAKSQYFEEQMTVLEEMADAPEPEIDAPLDIDQGFEPIDLDEEDMALADEADEMSMLDVEQLNLPDRGEDMFAQPDYEIESEQVEYEIDAAKMVEDIQALVNDEVFEQDFECVEKDIAPGMESLEAEPQQVENIPYLQQSFEQALSEASQEYGDENAQPNVLMVTPAMVEHQYFNTPKQVLKERTFHTVSKVPLKPAAEDTPMRPSPVKRSVSSSKIPSQRPTSNLGRKNTVISYSPEKSTPRAKTPVRDFAATPVTEWSSIATPARTPRRDLNEQLLKGAVVFVDVHTTEGADASVLFTELLTQMGARCVKTWNWNTNDESSKIGITHVVFKDGGKRTLEKIKAANGVVSCVGVGWVLE